MNTMRMPTAQTLLLFAHTIDTNSSFSRIVCDSWLCLDFPYPNTGQTLLIKATKLRLLWTKLLEDRLSGFTSSVESNRSRRDKNESEDQEMELWDNLANFLNTEVAYTIKKLLPADMKNLYVGPDSSLMEVIYNPFTDNFEKRPNTVKGGIYLTENITYGW